MRTGTLLAVAVGLAVVVGLAGQRRTDTALPIPAAEPRRSGLGDLDAEQPAPGGEATSLSGRVREVIDVAEYTYLRLGTAQGDAWAAVSKVAVAVGSDVTVENPTRMENFASSTLKRTFDVIYFGNLQSAAAAPVSNLPPGHPSIGDAAGSPAAGHAGLSPTTSENAGLPDVKVPRAPGKNARTIGELFADGAKLDGQLVRVRGQIVKVTAGVMGKTYLRLRDGSGSQPEQRELVVTTQIEPRIGDVSTFEGTVRTDVDVGIGYHYPVMLAEAQIVPDASGKPL